MKKENLLLTKTVSDRFKEGDCGYVTYDVYATPSRGVKPRELASVYFAMSEGKMATWVLNTVISPKLYPSQIAALAMKIILSVAADHGSTDLIKQIVERMEQNGDGTYKMKFHNSAEMGESFYIDSKQIEEAKFQYHESDDYHDDWYETADLPKDFAKEIFDRFNFVSHNQD